MIEAGRILACNSYRKNSRFFGRKCAHWWAFDSCRNSILEILVFIFHKLKRQLLIPRGNILLIIIIIC